MKVGVWAAVSAALFFVSAGVIGFWPAAWLAPVPILWLAYSGTRRWTLFLAAFGACAVGLSSLLLAYTGKMPVPVLILIIAGPALAFALAVALSALAVRRLPGILSTLAFPAATTAIAYLVSFNPAGGTFGSMAYSQVAMPWAIQSAAYFGLWSVDFILAWVATLLAFGLARWPSAGGKVFAALAVVLFAANLGFGYWRVQTPPEPTVRVERVGLADYDSLTDAGYSDTAAGTLQVTQAYADAVNTLTAQGATTVVTSEKIAILRPAWREAALQPLQEASARTGARIVAGFDDHGETLRNTALTLNPDGSVAAYYKRHLVLGLEHQVPGNGPGLLGNRLGVAICKDMDFQATIRADAEHDIGLMLVPAWDFGADGWLHARMAILRGVENGFALARSARDGVLTITDEYGRVLASAETQPHVLSSVVAEVAFGRGHTLYTRIGDVFAWGSLVLILVLTISGAAVSLANPGKET